jgi:hypothetical protein
LIQTEPLPFFESARFMHLNWCTALQCKEDASAEYTGRLGLHPIN